MGVYQPTGYNENYMYLNIGMQTMPNGLVSNDSGRVVGVGGGVQLANTVGSVENLNTRRLIFISQFELESRPYELRSWTI